MKWKRSSQNCCCLIFLKDLTSNRQRLLEWIYKHSSVNYFKNVFVEKAILKLYFIEKLLKIKKCIKNLFAYIQSKRQSSRGDVVRIAICTIIQHQLGFDNRTLTSQPNVTQCRSLMWDFGKAIQKLLFPWNFPFGDASGAE